MILRWYILGGLLLAMLVPTRADVRTNHDWVDAISGSRKQQKTWSFGYASPAVVTESPLAKRYRELGLRWEPEWRGLCARHFSLFGTYVGVSCGRAPPMHGMSFPGVQEWYLQTASDDEVRELFRVMNTGSEEEHKAAVTAACEKLERVGRSRAEGFHVDMERR